MRRQAGVDAVIARIGPASSELLAEIGAWEYEPPYDFYEGRHEPVRNPERFFAAFDADGMLIGFYYYELEDCVLTYGLGLRPDLIGQGRGLEFVLAGLELGRRRFRPQRIVLAVAAFNARAVRVYERAGFAVTGRHVRTFPEFGDVDFIDMEERC
jgi:[ribosomal protein S18]-alanine N-acetyltransferase